MQLTWKEFKEKVESLGISSIDNLVYYSIKEGSAFVPSENSKSMKVTRIEIYGIFNLNKNKDVENDS